MSNIGHPTKRMRRPTERAADLTNFLYGCTDDRLAHASVEELAHRYGIDRKAAEYALTIARQKRS